jgi:hypothetical protein
MTMKKSLSIPTGIYRTHGPGILVHIQGRLFLEAAGMSEIKEAYKLRDDWVKTARACGASWLQLD